jgi:predicted thioesterase
LRRDATTVGVWVEPDKLATSPGRNGLEVDAKLEGTAGRCLRFAVQLRDGDWAVVRGLITGS